MKEILTKLFFVIRKTGTMTIASSFILLGLISLSIEVFIFREYMGTTIAKILIPLSFFFFGLAGLPIIIRREAYFGIFSLHEFPAVLFGLTILLSGLAIAVLPIIAFVSNNLFE